MHGIKKFFLRGLWTRWFFVIFWVVGSTLLKELYHLILMSHQSLQFIFIMLFQILNFLHYQSQKSCSLNCLCNPSVFFTINSLINSSLTLFHRFENLNLSKMLQIVINELIYMVPTSLDIVYSQSKHNLIQDLFRYVIQLL